MNMRLLKRPRLRIDWVNAQLTGSVRSEEETLCKCYTLGPIIWCSVWSCYLNKNRRIRDKMNQSLKLITNRVICAYRTVSLDASSLLAHVPPVTLLADYRRKVYERVRDLHLRGEYSPKSAAEIKKEENLLLMRQWKIKVINTTNYGTRTVKAILPHFDQWLKRDHGSLEFHLTQILTGHGCFGTYHDPKGRVCLMFVL